MSMKSTEQETILVIGATGILGSVCSPWTVFP